MTRPKRQLGVVPDAPEAGSTPGFELDNDDGWYHPLREYTRSRNVDQAYATLGAVKVPEMVMNQMTGIVERKDIPGIRSTGDLVRSAVVHYLMSRKDVTEFPLDVEMAMRREALICAHQYEQAEMNGNVELVQSFKESCEMAVRLRDWRKVAILIMQGSESASSVRAPYSEDLMAEARLLEAKLPEEHTPFLRALRGLGDVDPSTYSHYMYQN